MTVLPQLENELLEAHERLQDRRAHGVRGLISRLAPPRRFGQPGWRRLVRVDVVVPVLSVLVAVGVAAAFLGVRGSSQRGGSGSSVRGGVQLVFQAEPTAESGVSPAALARAIDVIRSRADALGVAGPSIRAARGNRIVVTLTGVANANLGLAERALGSSARVAFYDWEADALTPNGETVASQLVAKDHGRVLGPSPTAIVISQGHGGFPMGSPGAGGLPLYQAVELAARQPRQVSRANARYGDQYYLFAASGSTACAIAGRAHGSAPEPGGHCLLSGPVDLAAGSRRSTALRQLAVGLPAGVRPADGQVLVIKQGTVVLQAAPSSFADWPAFGSPTAKYYVLEDRVALTSGEITQIEQATDQAGKPDVTFELTALGRLAFQRLTARIAERGASDSTVSTVLDQHFAVALDDQLLVVSSIDFRTYPDGITDPARAQITGRFTIATAQQLAEELRLGAPSVRLRLISETPLAAHH